MKLSISTNSEALKDAGASSFIGTEGIFDVTLNFVSISETSNKAQKVDFNLTYKDNNQVIYGPTITNKDGKPNEIGRSLINKLGVVLGLTEGDDLTVEQEAHKVGKDQKEQAFNVITDFSNQDVKIRVQREYTKYNGEVRRSLVIRNIFRTDGASAAEIVANGETGKQIAVELEKYCSAPSYRDGVTPAEAEDFEAAARQSKGADKPASPTSAVVGKKSTMFAS